MSGNGPIRDDDYLWDRSSPVDEDVARLERLLSPYAYRAERGPARDSGQAVPRGSQPVPRRRSARRRWRPVFAAAAAFALCAIGLSVWHGQRLEWEAGQPWRIVAQRGEVRIDGRSAAGVATLAPAGEIRTGADGALRLRVAGIGELALGEGSTLRLIETRTGRHRVQLQEGRLWARVWAPPGQFGVGMPGAEVYDLGCEFEIESDAAGNGILTVRSGWVQIENRWHEVLVPQGATVRLHGDAPPGTARDLGASAAFRAALDAIDAIDARGGDVDPRGAEVQRLIAASRREDAISLLSLLQRHPRIAEGPLFEHTARLLPTAATVDRAEVIAGRTHALAPWWSALPYPRMKHWWLQWPDALPAGNDAEVWLQSRKEG